MQTIQKLTHWEITIDSLSYREQVQVPHTWNVHEKTEHYRGKARYRTTLPIAKEAAATRLHLCFGAVYHTAEVFVNGVRVGIHSGSGYTPFSFDITETVHFGEENEIVVLADNTPAADMLPHVKDFDWADDGGLIREVNLIIADGAELQTLYVTPRLQTMRDTDCDGELELQLTRFDGGRAGKAAVTVREWESGREVLQKTIALTDNAGSLPFEKLRLWDFDHPALYELTVETDGGKKTARFGCRSIAVQCERIYLNGKAVYLTGCEWMPGSHPDYGMAEIWEHSRLCLKQLKDSGCRFTRFHWQQDDRLFDWCDENGLLVQEEIPYWGSPKQPGAQQLALAKKQADEMLAAHRNHPSIVCWGVGNELGGQFEACQQCSCAVK